jgi:hypothetical protein
MYHHANQTHSHHRKGKAMINLNGNKYAENEAEFMQSLFEHGGTCTGYAKRHKRRIDLFDAQHCLLAIINKWGVLCEANGTTYGFASDPLQTKLGADKMLDWDRAIADIAISRVMVSSGPNHGEMLHTFN